MKRRDLDSRSAIFSVSLSFAVSFSLSIFFPCFSFSLSLSFSASFPIKINNEHILNKYLVHISSISNPNRLSRCLSPTLSASLSLLLSFPLPLPFFSLPLIHLNKKSHSAESILHFVHWFTIQSNESLPPAGAGSQHRRQATLRRAALIRDAAAADCAAAAAAAALATLHAEAESLWSTNLRRSCQSSWQSWPGEQTDGQRDGQVGRRTDCCGVTDARTSRHCAADVNERRTTNGINTHSAVDATKSASQRRSCPRNCAGVSRRRVTKRRPLAEAAAEARRRHSAAQCITASYAVPEKLCYELQALRVYSEKRVAITVSVAVDVDVDVTTLRCVVFRGKSVS